MACPLLEPRAAVGKRQCVNGRSLNRIMNQPFTFVHTAQRKIKRMKINRSRSAGFTLVEIMIVVAIIALLAAIAIPNFVKARTASQRSACIANLKQVNGAKATWALEAKKVNADSPADSDLFGATQYIRQKPACPGGGAYTVDIVANLPTCSLGPTDGHTL